MEGATLRPLALHACVFLNVTQADEIAQWRRLRGAAAAAEAAAEADDGSDAPSSVDVRILSPDRDDAVEPEVDAPQPMDDDGAGGGGAGSPGSGPVGGAGGAGSGSPGRAAASASGGHAAPRSSRGRGRAGGARRGSSSSASDESDKSEEEEEGDDDDDDDEEEEDDDDVAADPNFRDENEVPGADEDDEDADAALSRDVVTAAALLLPGGAHVGPGATAPPGAVGDDAVPVALFVPPSDPATGFAPLSVDTVARLLRALGWRRRGDAASYLRLDDLDRADVAAARDVYVATLTAERHRILSVPTPHACAVLTGHDPAVPYTDDELRTLGLAPENMNVAGKPQRRPLMLLAADETSIHCSDVGASVTWRPAARDGVTEVSATSRDRGAVVMMYGIVSLFAPEDATLISVGGGKTAGGYWTTERCVPLTVDLVQRIQGRYPGVELWLLLDNSSNHLAAADDAPIVSRLNKGPGGVRKGAPIRVRDTYRKYDAVTGAPVDGGGDVIRLSRADGEPLGLTAMARDLFPPAGGWPAGAAPLKGAGSAAWTPAHLMEYLEAAHPPFRYARHSGTALATALARVGVRVVYLPRFHCMLNPIERVWAWLKRWARAHAATAEGASARVRMANAMAGAWRELPRAAPEYVAASWINAWRYTQLFGFGCTAETALAVVRALTGHGPVAARVFNHRELPPLPVEEDDVAGAGTPPAGGAGAGGGGVGGSAGSGGGAASAGGGDADDAEAQAAAVAARVAEAAEDPTPRLSWAEAERLARAKGVDVDGKKGPLGGFLPKSARHDDTCRACGLGPSLGPVPRALHACTYDQFSFHTDCIRPRTTAMPLPGVKWGCPTCAALLERELLADDANAPEVEAAAARCAPRPLESRDPVVADEWFTEDDKAHVMLLLMLWTPPRTYARTERRLTAPLRDRIVALLAAGGTRVISRVARAVSQGALDLRGPMHPIVRLSIERLGRIALPLEWAELEAQQPPAPVPAAGGSPPAGGAGPGEGQAMAVE